MMKGQINSETQAFLDEISKNANEMFQKILEEKGAVTDKDQKMIMEYIYGELGFDEKPDWGNRGFLECEDWIDLRKVKEESDA